MRVTKQFEFEMAHMLANHPSLCKNLHGHSYKLFVTVEGPVVDDMVIDFKDLKEVVKELIVDPLDHCFAYNLYTDDEFEKDLIEIVQKHNKKSMAFPFRTTCENMSKWMFNVLNTYFNQNLADFEVCKIKLYETSTSYCEYAGE